MGGQLLGLAHRRHLALADLPRDLGRRAAARHLLVRRDVERDEQHQVRAQDNVPGDGREGLAGAGPDVRPRGAVGRGEVVPGREVDEAWSGGVSVPWSCT
jgi:hypothetical protein